MDPSGFKTSLLNCLIFFLVGSLTRLTCRGRRAVHNLDVKPSAVHQEGHSLHSCNAW